jgi:hypothetical protein
MKQKEGAYVLLARLARIYVKPTITYVIGASLCSDVQNTNKPSSSRTSRDLDMTSWKSHLAVFK